MTRTEFLNHIHHPELIEPEQTAVLKDMVERFPYCATFHILYTYGLFRDNDLDFPSRLKITAAYSSNRIRIKHLLEELQNNQVSSSPGKDEAPPVVDGFPVMEEEAPPAGVINELPPEPVTDFILPVQNEAVEEEPKKKEEELIEIVRRRLEEIKAERGYLEAEEDYIPEDETDKPGQKLVTKEELIEKFIREEPRISQPKVAFFSPSENAFKSNIDDDVIVSETLARLYHEQGNTAKAIRTYEKLILLFPEKSRYFADQIKKIKE